MSSTGDLRRATDLLQILNIPLDKLPGNGGGFAKAPASKRHATLRTFPLFFRADAAGNAAVGTADKGILQMSW